MLANDCGISHPTARSWLSVLETSFIVKLLRPHHRNFNKRLPRRVSIFASLVLSELTKDSLNRGLEPDLFFRRDSAGR